MLTHNKKIQPSSAVSLQGVVHKLAWANAVSNILWNCFELVRISSISPVPQFQPEKKSQMTLYIWEKKGKKVRPITRACCCLSATPKVTRKTPAASDRYLIRQVLRCMLTRVHIGRRCKNAISRLHTSALLIWCHENQRKTAFFRTHIIYAARTIMDGNEQHGWKLTSI